MLENTINLSLLSEKAQEELLLFYQFLLKKTKEESKVKANFLPQTFYSPLKTNRYVKFDRDEIYADR